MIKKQWLILTLMLTMLTQAACTTLTTPVVPTIPATSVPTANPEGTCPTATADLKLLMNAEDGYCLLFPADYSTDVAHFIVINPVSGPGDVLGEAWASMDMEAAAGRTPAQVADAQIDAVGPDFNIERSEVVIDGAQAVVVDGLPGPDPWHKVFIVSNERLYTLTFLPWLPNTVDTEQPTPLEHLYTTIINSLHFLPPTNALPTATQPWGPGHLPPPLVFEYPVDQAVIDYEGSYLFKVTDIEGAEGYLWSFSQNGVVVWENLRDEMGLTAGGEYAILEGTEAHGRFVPGPVAVSVSAKMGDYLTDPVVITIILQPR